jgi:hypothetical protein
MRSVQPVFFKGDFTKESGGVWMDGWFDVGCCEVMLSELERFRVVAG